MNSGKITLEQSMAMTASWRADRTNSLWIWGFGISIKFVDVACAVLFLVCFSYDNAVQLLNQQDTLENRKRQFNVLSAFIIAFSAKILSFMIEL